MSLISAQLAFMLTLRESPREGMAFPVLLTLAGLYWLWKLLRKAAREPERDR